MQRERNRYGRLALSVVALAAVGTVAEVAFNEPQPAFAAYCGDASDTLCGFALPTTEKQPYCYVTEVPVEFTLTSETAPGPVTSAQVSGTYTYPGGGAGNWRMNIVGPISSTTSSPYHTGPSWGLNNAGNPYAIFYGDLGKTNLFLTPSNSPASAELVQFRPNADADYLNGWRNTFVNHTNHWAFDRTYAQYRLDDPSNQTTRNSGVYADTVLVYQRTALDNRLSDYVVTGDSLSLWVQEHGASAYEGWSQSAIAKYTTCLTVTETGSYVDANGNGYPDPGDHVLFTYVVTNPGSAELSGLNLADSGVTMSTSNFTVAGGASVTVTGEYPLTAADILNGSVTRNATATGADLFGNTVTDLADSPLVATNTDPEGDGEPDDPTTVTLPPPPVDLAVTKTDDADPIRIGDTVTYTITVTNNGPGTVADTDTFAVFDDLPPGLVDPTYSIPAPGVWDGPSGEVTGVKLVPGESVELTVTAVAATSGTTVKNVATAKSPTGDPDDSNNSAVEETTILPRADLKITKTAMPTPVTAGTDITWTITVANGGPDDATGVVVTDVIPSEVTSPIVTGCTLAGDTCAIGDLAAGASTIITITASVPADTPAGTKIDNTASVTSTSEDPDLANNTAAVSTPVDAEADVVLVKSSSPNPYVPGEPITYTFTVRNSGPSIATGVVVKDSFPAGLLGMVADNQTCAFSGADMTCELGTLEPSETVVITVTADTDPGLVDPLKNEAAVLTDSPDPNLSNNTSLDENGAKPLADLRVVKTDLADPVLAGDSISYTVSITNLGPSVATAVQLGDEIAPSGLGLALAGTPAVTAGDGSCTAAGCDFNSIAVGETVVVTYAIDVPQDVVRGTTVTNTATATSADVADPDESNNAHIETTGIETQADLSITKVGDGVPVAGQNYTYTLTVANAGPSIANTTTVTDELPAGVTFVAADSSPTCAAAGSTVTCDVTTLTAGTQTVFTLVVAVDPSFTGTIANTATVDPAPNAEDPDLTNNQATDSGVASAEADLAVTKSVNKTSASAGTSIEWTMVVTNNGPSTATGVTLDDTIPAGVSVTSVTSTVGATTCTTASGCTIGTLAPGDVATVTIVADIDPALIDGEVLANSVAVSADPVDPDPSNDTADVATTVDSVADISIVKTANPNPFTPGTPLTYNVTATNLGPSRAVGAAFVDELPANFAYTGYTVTSGNGTCSLAGTTLTCSADPMAPGGVFGVAIAGDTDAGSTAATTNTVTMVTPTTYTDPKAVNDSSSVTVGSAPDADLGISKTPIGSTTTPGTTKRWTVNVTNAGPTNATGVEVTDALPDGVIFVSAAPSNGGGACSHDGAATGGVITCQLGDVAANGIVSIDVETMLDPSIADGADLTNTARVTSAINDSDVTNNEASATVTAQRIADVSITKVDDPDPVIAGDTVTWTITLANSGPSDAGAVTVTDAVPAGFTITSVTPSGCTTAGNDISCALGAIGPGAAVEVVVVAAASPSYVADGLTNPLTNTATVASPDDVDVSNNQADATTLVVERSDVSVTKAGPAEVAVGNTITWTIDVANAGPSVADAVSVTDTIPTGVVVDPADITGTGCSLSGNSLQCDLGRLGVGESSQVVVTGTVPANYLASGNPVEMYNYTSVTSDSTDVDPLNNDASVGTVVTEQANLAITKVGDPAEVNAGEQVTWTVTVTNSGPADAREVKVTDALPGWVTVDSATADNGGACDGAATCLLGTIPVGATVSIEIVGTVAADQPEGPFVNTATVAALTPDPDASNNSADATTSVLVQSDISITKVGPATATPGTPISYTVVVTNNGPSDAAGVVVTDAIPAWLLNATATTDTGSCSSAAVCDLDVLAAGQSAQVTVTADIDPSTTDTEIVNVVNAASDTADPDLTNNEAAATVAMAPAADVSLTKTDSVDPVIAGTNLTWTLTATNAGPSVARNVSIGDTLPAGVTLVAAPGCTGTTALTCPVGDLAPGGTAAIDITVEVSSDYYPDGQTSPLTNTAQVSTSTNDTGAGNNTATETTTVAALAGVSIGKDATAAEAVAGEDITWKLTVLNTGPSAAQDVVITDTLPAGTTFVSATGATCSPTSGTIECALGTVPTDTPVVVTLVAHVDDGYVVDGRSNPVSNTAQVVSSTPDEELADNSAVDTVPIVDRADLSITKSATPSVDAGTDVTWNIEVTNAGPSVARSVTLDDVVPPGTTIRSVSPAGQCTTDVACSLGDIAVGATVSVTIVATVDSSWAVDGRPPTLTNTADVSSPSDTTSANNSASADTTINERAAIELTKRVTPDPVVAGEQITWTIDVSNPGPSDARLVAVDDPLPTGVSIVSVNSSSGASCSFSVACTIPVIPAGGTSTVTIVATVDSAWFTNGGADTISNTADATTPSLAGATVTDSVTSNITAEANLAITKTDAGTPVAAGAPVRWTITVTNPGPSDAPSTEITDTLPAGIDLATVAVTAGAATCDQSALPVLTCDVGTLAVGASTTITVSATVASTYLADGRPNPMPNTATVTSAATELDSADNMSTSVTSIVETADISVVKTGPSNIAAGQSIEWSLKIGNVGPSAATQVTVTDEPPDGVTIAAMSSDCTFASGLIKCTAAVLPIGETKTFTVTADVPVDYVSTGQPSPISNTATITANTPDANFDDNTSSVDTEISDSADLAITKSVSPETVTAGTDATWTVTVRNDGPSVSRKVELSDALPPGYTATAVTTDNAGTCDITGACLLGDLAPGETVTVTIEGGVDADVVAASLTNTATATALTPDPDVTNNSATATANIELNADLSVTKLGPASVVAGEALHYDITIENLGPSDAAAVTLDEVLPTDLIGVTLVPSQGTCQSDATRCDLGSLAVGQSATITVDATLDSASTAASITNAVSVSSATPDLVDANDTASSTASVAATADLSITKSDSVDPVIAGAPLTWTIKVSNAGPSVARGVLVDDPLPAGVTFVSSTDPRCVATGSSVGCDLGDLVSGASVEFDVVVSVDAGYYAIAGLESPLVNTATVSSPTDTTTANNSWTEQTTVAAEAGVSVGKNADVSIADAGTTINWTINVHNAGPSVAANVTVTDPVPDGLTIDSTSFDLSGAPGQTCSVGTTIECSLGSMAVGETIAINVASTVDASYTGDALNKMLENAATASSDTPDPYPSDNSGADQVRVDANSDVFVVKTGPVGAVNAGDPISWTVKVTNTGPSTAQQVTLTDAIPTGILDVSTEPACDLTAGCDLGDIAPNASAEVTISGTVSPNWFVDGGSDTVTNTAAIVSASDTNPDNNTSSVTTSISERASLNAAKTADPDPVNPGSPVTWTITVDNTGPSAARSVVISDPALAGVEVVSAVVAVGDVTTQCTFDVTCTVDSLAAGGRAVVTIVASVDAAWFTAGGGATITNIATITSATNPDDSVRADVTSGVVAAVDLVVDKSDKVDPVVAGGPVTWTIDVANQGPSDSPATVVTDTLPAGLDPASVVVSTAPTTATCDLTNLPTLTCDFGVVAAGTTVRMTVSANVVSNYFEAALTSPMSNVASAQSAIADTNEADNTDTETTAVVPLADVSLTKSGPTAVIAGEAIRWTIIVQNAGPSTATGVNVSDAVPDGVDITAAVADGGAGEQVACGVSAQSVSCAIGSMPIGAERVVTIDGVVQAGYVANVLPAGLTNSAAVTAATPDDVGANNSSTWVTTVGEQANLNIAKVPVQADAVSGGDLDWTITVNNPGPSVAQDVVVNDLLPGGYIVSSVTASSGATCDAAATCNLGDLDPNASVVITVRGKVAGSTLGATLENTGSVDAATPDSNRDDNTAVASVPLAQRADIEVAKAGPIEVTPGTDATYTVTVTNKGPSDAFDVVIAESLPEGFVGAVSTPSVGTCQSPTSCSIGTLTAGQTATIDVTGAFQPDLVADNVTNTATGSSSTADPDIANNAASATSTVHPVADISVAKDDVADAVYAGDLLTWNLTVVNNGPSHARDVEIADQLPAGVTLVSAPSDCTNGGPLTCAVGDLAPLATRTLTVVVKVNPDYTAVGLPSPLTNQATATTSTDDSDAGNNASADTTTVAASAGLSIAKDANVSEVNAGTRLTWNVSVTNNGPSVATDVVVNDALAPGTTFVSAVPDNGSNCSISGVNLTCTLGQLAVDQTVAIPVTVDVDAGYVRDQLPANLTNTATVTSPTPDADVNDNTATDAVLVTESADLSTSKVGPGSLDAGATGAWEITVTNAGPSIAREVSLIDMLPAGVSIVTATTGTGTCEAATCSLGDLAPGATATVNLTATVSSTWVVDQRPATFSNVATATSPTPDTDTENNTASATTTITESAAIRVTKTASVETAIAGAPVVWQIAVVNDGPSAARDVQIVDPAPAGVSIGDAMLDVAGTCTFDVACTVPTLAVGQTASATIIADVDAGWLTAGRGDLTNVATVTTPTNPGGSQEASVTTPVEANVDLGIEKSVAETLVPAGGQVHWTLTVHNSGPSDAPSFSIVDSLPEGLTNVVVNAPSGLSCDTAALPTVTCVGGVLAAGAAVEVNVGAAVQASYFSEGLVTPLVNRAEVSSPEAADVDPTNNSAASSVQIADIAGVAIGKQTISNRIVAGQPVTWKLQVTNAGPGYANAVTITDPIPAGVTVDTAGVMTSAGTCSVAGNPDGQPGSVVSCELGDVAPGVTAVVTVTGLVSSRFAIDSLGTASDGTPNALVNSAAVSSTSDDPQPADNTASSTANVVDEANLDLTKDVVDTGVPMVAGQPIAWTITAVNHGPSVSSQVVISDPIPAGVTIDTANADDPGFACQTDAALGAHGTIICTGPELAVVGPDGSEPGVTIAISGRVAANYLAGGFANPLTNSAAATAATPDPTPATANATSDITGSANLVTSKSVIGPSEGAVVAGTEIAWRVSVQNLGPSDAQSVTISDPLPAAVAFVSATPTVGTCTVNPAQVVECQLGDLALGATADVIVTATVSASAISAETTPDGSVTNTASAVSVTPDPVVDPTATVVTPIATSADISVVKTDALDPIVAGQRIQWSVDVRNDGPSVATSVELNDPIPVGVTVTTVTASDASPCSVSAAVTCTFAQIPPGDVRTVTIIATVSTEYAADGNGTIVNTATATAADPDPNPANNAGSESTNVVANAGLSIAKTVDVDAVTAGGAVTWTLTAINQGPSAALGVQISDRIPAGVTVTSVDAPDGVSCDEAVECTVGKMAPGSRAVVTIRADVRPDAVALGTTSLVNTATVTSSTPDTTPNDNSASTTTAVVAAADLSLIKTAGAPTAAGGTLEWTLTAHNDGPSAAVDVVVTDLVPPGLVVVSAAADNGLPCTTEVRCSLGTLGPDATVVITVKTSTPTSSATNEFVNSANIASPTPDPDPTNNGASATGASVGAQIGVAKAVASGPTSNGDGTFTIGYAIVVENMGQGPLAGVQIFDDLGAAFGGAQFAVDSLTSPVLTVNTGYTGTATSPLLAGSDVLQAGSRATIILTATVTPTTPQSTISNSAVASASPTTGVIVSDVSQAGEQPDADGDGDAADDNQPTVVKLSAEAKIAVAKQIEGAPIRNADGTVTVAFAIDVINAGDVRLDNVQVVDDLSAAFAAAAAFRVSSVRSGSLTVNPAYDGVNDQKLLTGTQSLAPTSGNRILLVVVVTPSADSDTYTNRAVASAAGPGGSAVSDLSNEGTFGCGSGTSCAAFGDSNTVDVLPPTDTGDIGTEVTPPPPPPPPNQIIPMTGADVISLLLASSMLTALGGSIILASRKRRAATN